MNEYCVDKEFVPVLLDKENRIGNCLIFVWPYNLLQLETFALGRHCSMEIFLKYWQIFSNSDDMFQRKLGSCQIKSYVK